MDTIATPVNAPRSAGALPSGRLERTTGSSSTRSSAQTRTSAAGERPATAASRPENASRPPASDGGRQARSGGVPSVRAFDPPGKSGSSDETGTGTPEGADRASAGRELRDDAAASDAHVGALDIGGTWIRAARVSPDGRIIARSRHPMPRGSRGQDIVDICVGALRDVGADGSGPNPVARIGVSVTGPVDPTTGTLFTPPNADSNLAGLALGEELSKATGLEVRVDRDTNVAALGEHRFGAARGVSNFVYMTVSTGVGGAVMLDGRLLRGVDGVAGEIGHIVVDFDGPTCGCGRKGCLEAIASGLSIARRATALVMAGPEGNAIAGQPGGRSGGRADDLPAAGLPGGQSGPLAEIAASRELTGKDVDACAEAGDLVARSVLDSAAAAVASACADMANTFNPELIVIGGGVAIAHPHWLGLAAECVAQEALVPANRRDIVVPAALGDDVSLIGAVAL